MSNASMELDSANILETYRQVNDTPHPLNRVLQSKLHQKNRALEEELSHLKEKYTSLQTELSQRETRMARLKELLIEKTDRMSRLQEDFEHAIYQLTQKKEA